MALTPVIKIASRPIHPAASKTSGASVAVRVSSACDSNAGSGITIRNHVDPVLSASAKSDQRLAGRRFGRHRTLTSCAKACDDMARMTLWR